MVQILVQATFSPPSPCWSTWISQFVHTLSLPMFWINLMKKPDLILIIFLPTNLDYFSVAQKKSFMLLTLYWLSGHFSSKYSSQPQTFKIYLPWYSKTQSFSCSDDSNILRVFFLIASAITCSGTQSWLIFRVYFCLSLFGETITQITTIICPGINVK